MRVRKLGAVEFAMNSMFVAEDEAPDDVMATMRMAADGSHVVFAQRIVTPYITLESRENGWIDEAQKDQLLAMRSDLSATWTLEYVDGTTEEVRFAHEKKLSFTPLFEGSDHYTAVIPLAKA